MVLECMVRGCNAPSRNRARFSWRGYYYFRCTNGHVWKLATPKKAAANWARLSSSEAANPSASAESS